MRKITKSNNIMDLPTDSSCNSPVLIPSYRPRPDSTHIMTTRHTRSTSSIKRTSSPVKRITDVQKIKLPNSRTKMKISDEQIFASTITVKKQKQPAQIAESSERVVTSQSPIYTYGNNRHFIRPTLTNPGISDGDTALRELKVSTVTSYTNTLQRGEEQMEMIQRVTLVGRRRDEEMVKNLLEEEEMKKGWASMWSIGIGLCVFWGVFLWV